MSVHSEFESITEKALGQGGSFCILSQWLSKINLIVQWLLPAGTIRSKLHKGTELTVYDWHRKISYTLLSVFLVDCTAFWSSKLFLQRMFSWCFMSPSKQSGCIKASLCSGEAFARASLPRMLHWQQRFLVIKQKLSSSAKVLILG